MTTTIWHKKTIEEYLTALGSKSETPAGGVQAAFIGAQACAPTKSIMTYILKLLFGWKHYNWHKVPCWI